MVKVGADSVRAWVVYPQRSTKAPVVIVVHEIFGLTTWIRAVADQLAADGFIAIAPDLLTGKLPPNLSDSALTAQGPAVIRTLDAEDVQRKIDAVAQYGMSLPAATKKYGIVGYCWGGGVSFAHAAHAGTSPTFGASVVYYGTPPKDLTPVRAPVLGLYGGKDQGIPVASVEQMREALKKSTSKAAHESELVVYPDAGHGFNADYRPSYNKEAATDGWQRLQTWFKKHGAA